MKKRALIFAAFAALLVAGGASAQVLTTIWLKPGSCTKVGPHRVCARHVSPSTVTQTVTSTVTQTVTTTTTPCTATENYSGGNTQGTLEPTFTTCQGETLSWSLTTTGGSSLQITDETTGHLLVNSNSSGSGAVYLPAGTHSLWIQASGLTSWTVSIS